MSFPIYVINNIIIFLTPYEIYCLRCISKEFDNALKGLNYTLLYRLGYIETLERAYELKEFSLTRFHAWYYCKRLFCWRCLEEKDILQGKKQYDFESKGKYYCLDCYDKKDVSEHFLMLDNCGKITEKRERTSKIIRITTVSNSLLQYTFTLETKVKNEALTMLRYGKKIDIEKQKKVIDKLNKLFLF